MVKIVHQDSLGLVARGGKFMIWFMILIFTPKKRIVIGSTRFVHSVQYCVLKLRVLTVPSMVPRIAIFN